MGLLLSVLVACVGVVELLAFYSNITRSLVTVSTQTSFDNITQKYLEGLERHRQHLQSQIELSLIEDDAKTDIDEKSGIFDFVKSISKSRSQSPHKDKLNFEVITENATGGHTLQINSIAKESSPLPEITLNSNEIYKLHSQTPSPISEPEVFRRSPSPYPPLVLPVPRNSICSELENAQIPLPEVDEESISRSPTPEKLHVILESKHNTTDYWTNKILVVPPIKARPSSPLEVKNFPESPNLSKSPNIVPSTSENFTIESLLTNNDDDEIKTLDAQFLDSLDGVKKKKLSRSNSLRRSRKKKSNLSLDFEPKDDSLSSSMQNNVAQTAKTLTEAANVLKTVNQEADGSAGTSKDSTNGDPFWVNR